MTENAKIPLFRPLVSPLAMGSVCDVLTYAEDGSIYLGEGPVVRKFEVELDRVYGVPGDGWADGSIGWLAVNSCTSALYLALQLCGAGPGKRVVSTPVTCSLTNSPACLRCAETVWADVDRVTGLVDVEDAASKVDEHTVAVVVVDFAGRRVDYAGLRAAMRRHGRVVPIIQDAAHLGPALIDPDQAGDYVCLSFQAIKFLTSGDGGALLCPTHERGRAKRLRWAGLERDTNVDFRSGQDIVEVGGKFHMTDLLASIGLSNMQAARNALTVQRDCAAYYWEAMGHRLVANRRVRLPPPDAGSHWWLYVLSVEDRDGLRDHLATRGVVSGPVHRRNDAHTAFKEHARTPGALDGVAHFDPRQLAVPVGWWLDHLDRRRVVDAVLEWAEA